MTSTRQATPLHAFVLATLLVAMGGVMQMNRNPVAEFISNALHSSGHIDASSADQATAAFEQQGSAQSQEPARRETTAQKRARYAPLIVAAANESKVEAALIEAVITAESAFNPLAVSRTGAVGLMQLMPDTAKRFGVTDRTDPEQNILGGAKYLNFLLRKFGDPRLAIAAYNAGEGNIKKHGNKIPPFEETRKYVPKVLAFYNKYRDDNAS